MLPDGRNNEPVRRVPSALVNVPFARAGQMGFVEFVDTDDEVVESADELELATMLDDPRVIVVPVIGLEVERVEPPTIIEVFDDADTAVADSWALVDVAESVEVLEFAAILDALRVIAVPVVSGMEIERVVPPTTCEVVDDANTAVADSWPLVDVAESVEELEFAAILDAPRVIVVPAVSGMEVERVEPPTITEVFDDGDTTEADSWALVDSAEKVGELEFDTTLDDPRVIVVPAVRGMEAESVEPPITVIEVVDEANTVVADSWALVEFVT